MQNTHSETLSSINSSASALSYFVIISSLHMMFITSTFFNISIPDFGFTLSSFFHIFIWSVYSFLYVLIALIPLFVTKLFRKKSRRTDAVLATVLSSISLLFIHADAMIFDLYNFHFNSFVWNLITTKGGISSLGSSGNTYISIVLSIAITVTVQIAAWFSSIFIAQNTSKHIKIKHLLYLLLIFLVVESLMYGVSDIKNYGPILDTARNYPFYKTVTFRSAAEKLGFKSIRVKHNNLSIDTSRIHYPLTDISFTEVKNPPNIVILVAESLRWDRLTPEIMPNVWSMAQKGIWYKNHYSSGNGTREGLFGMFYGLYGSYWSSFLHAQRSPLLMDRLHMLGYQLDIRTSASFSYPEFNRTLFANIPLDKLHEANDKFNPWQMDQENASQLIEFVKKREKNKPFMSFFFFESTHARYDFPETAVIAQPYLKDVNYWQMSRASLAPKIGELKNRYTNAAHWVDAQMGRVLQALEADGALDNTIVIITGDHGEEFMEKGFWGHNSTFVEQQTHTPMVVWMPGTKHQEITRMTSHLDISPTLLQLLGAPMVTEPYSLGESLLSDSKRQYIVSSDWHSISVMTKNLKYRIPYVSKGFEHWQPTGLSDQFLNEQEESRLMQENQISILDAIKNSTKFLAR